MGHVVNTDVRIGWRHPLYLRSKYTQEKPLTHRHDSALGVRVRCSIARHGVRMHAMYLPVFCPVRVAFACASRQYGRMQSHAAAAAAACLPACLFAAYPRPKLLRHGARRKEQGVVGGYILWKSGRLARGRWIGRLTLSCPPLVCPRLTYHSVLRKVALPASSRDRPHDMLVS